MDKVRDILQIVKRHHFWILLGVIVIACLVGWWPSAGALKTQYTENVGKVTTQINNVRSVVNEPSHPNETVIQKIGEETTSLSDKVLARWRELYSRQKDEVLIWPAEVASMQDYKKGDLIQPIVLTTYQNNVDNYFDRLHLIVSAQPPGLTTTPSEQTRRGRGRGLQFQGRGRGRRGAAASFAAEQEQGPDYIVDWKDQISIKETEFQFDAQPSPTKMLITQENLWVLETLLKIIAKVNEGAAGSYNAPIKEITQLAVGQDAANESDTTNRILRRADPNATNTPLYTSTAPPVTDPNAFANADEAADALLKEGRYLDSYGNPRPAAQADVDIEFKRLPILMELRMDERKLPELLVHCANAALPIEIKQIRIAPESSAQASGTRQRRGNLGGGNAQDLPTDPAVLPIILQGITYIYKQPPETPEELQTLIKNAPADVAPSEAVDPYVIPE